MRKKRDVIEHGSTNVFADLGFADPEEKKLKVQLAMRLNALLEERGVSQSKVAILLGIPQPHVSDLVNYRLNRFPSERLLHLITLLDRDVEILIRPKSTKHQPGVVSVFMTI